MEYGAKYGNIRTYYWKQTNNAVEFIIRAIKSEIVEKFVTAGFSRELVTKIVGGYLESCGVNSVVNCCAAHLGPKTPDIKQLFGWARDLVSLDDVGMLFLNNPDNVDLVRAILPTFDGTLRMENRLMPLHILIAQYFFHIKAEYKKPTTYEEVCKQVKFGNTVGVHLQGHYTGAVRYVDEGDFLKINDSWGNRKPEWKGDGFNQVLERNEFVTAHKEIVIYYKP